MFQRLALIIISRGLTELGNLSTKDADGTDRYTLPSLICMGSFGKIVDVALMPVLDIGPKFNGNLRSFYPLLITTSD